MHGSIVRISALHSYHSCISLTLTLLLLTGCQLTQSGFARIAGNAGGEFSAAATTLLYLHEGKLTSIYAASSFADYQSKLDGTEQQLSSQKDIPDMQTLHSLLTFYKPALQAVDTPCLSSACDWHRQVAALQQASEAFLKAAGQ